MLTGPDLALVVQHQCPVYLHSTSPTSRNSTHRSTTTPSYIRPLSHSLLLLTPCYRTHSTFCSMPLPYTQTSLPLLIPTSTSRFSTLMLSGDSLHHTLVVQLTVLQGPTHPEFGICAHTGRHSPRRSCSRFGSEFVSPNLLSQISTHPPLCKPYDCR